MKLTYLGFGWTANGHICCSLKIRIDLSITITLLGIVNLVTCKRKNYKFLKECCEGLENVLL